MISPLLGISSQFFRPDDRSNADFRPDHIVEGDNLPGFLEGNTRT